MESDLLSTSSRDEFSRARRQAFVRSAVGLLRGTTAELLPFEQVREGLHLNLARDLGLQEVPLDRIIGSVGRYRDFTREFLPRHPDQEIRWRRIYDLQNASVGLPAIEVYKVSDVFFVRDGNHRVSVARAGGRPTIEAYVAEYSAPVPVTSQDSLDAILIRNEAAQFLQLTELDRLRPGHGVELTNPGRYELLLEHIAVHRYLKELERSVSISYADAVQSWYDSVYAPLIDEIRRREILRAFPGRTEADLYAWLVLHRGELETVYGFGEVDDADVVDDLERGGRATLTTRLRRILPGRPGRVDLPPLPEHPEPPASDPPGST